MYLAIIFLIAYMLAWWAVFWIPARRRLWSPLSFIPAWLCAFSVPMLVHDIPALPVPKVFLIGWSILPFGILTIQFIWFKAQKNPKISLHGLRGRWFLFIILFAFCFVWLSSGLAQSQPLKTDRARVTVASIADPFGGPNLKVLRTDANTPLRAGTAWIWEKERREEPESYYASMRANGLNAVRMILFDTWEVEAYAPSAVFTPTDWNDPAYRSRQLARMERAVNYASAQGMYVVINSHNKIPNYAADYCDALWTHVASYFAARTHVLYEAANEPMDGIGNNGSMTSNASDNAANFPRIQALKKTYNIIRKGAPNTHIMILSPPGINDYATGTGLGNLAAAFASLPGTVDWTKTSVAYHLYNNDSAYGAATKAANLRNLHSRFPGWPSENNFPASVSNAVLGITDKWRSAQFDSDIYVNQTCERLGLGWSMWNINGQAQLDRNWPIMWADAVAKNWSWAFDPPAGKSVQKKIK